MSSKDLCQLNPLTGTAPLFRSERDRSISLALHLNRPILADESVNGWQINSVLMFMVNAAMTHHKTAEELESIGYEQAGNHFLGNGDEWFPLYEGKMVGAFDHRAASIKFDPSNRVRRNQPDALSETEHGNPLQMALPLFWVSRENIIERCSKVPNYCLVVKDVTSSTNERTSIAAILPSAALTDSVPWLNNPHNAGLNACLCGILNSFSFDFAARQKVAGLHLRGHYLAQLPLISLADLNADCIWHPGLSTRMWLELRVLELTYTAWDLETFAKDCGFNGPPFRWDETRRFQLRCELDAAFFHLYGIERDDVDYIMETFPIVKRKDEAQYGRFRTKETILKIYDEMGRVSSVNAAEVAAGRQAVAHFQTHCDPEPGPPTDANSNFLSMYQWDRDNWPIHIHQPHPDWDESIFAAWFDACRQQGTYLEDDQIFPWDGRETFVYALIPYLVQEKQGEKFEFYRDAALLASRPASFERLLLDDDLQNDYRQLTSEIAWLNFADGQHIRSSRIRETLQKKQIVQTAANTGVTEVPNKISLPPIPMELMPLLPLILKAADNLDKLQRGALEAAEAAKTTLSQDEIANELKALSAA